MDNQLIARIRELALQHEILDRLYSIALCLEDDEVYTKRDAVVDILEVVQIVENNMGKTIHPDELRVIPVSCELQAV